MHCPLSISIKIRPAAGVDIPILSDMLFEAGAVSETVREMGREKALALPAMILFLENFGRSKGDFGFIAETADKTLVGAVWARLFSEENKSYGFVSEEIPELAIAVVPEFRGHGAGTKLMQQLIEEARNLSFPALSLSVDRRNPALRLYQHLGFRDANVSKETDSSLTMILKFD
jgi:ribosomal protein S18 acetylase RimI-like enzyme